MCVSVFDGANLILSSAELFVLFSFLTSQILSPLCIMHYSLNFVLQIDQAVNTSLHFDLHEGGTLELECISISWVFQMNRQLSFKKRIFVDIYFVDIDCLFD